jgi:rabenosyn-5
VSPNPTSNIDNVSDIGGLTGIDADVDAKAALVLQPLLEQEALLESFVEEAQAQRKFEDVKTLKVNLGEIRAEIEKILANTQGGI